MDKTESLRALQQGAATLGVELDNIAAEKLLRLRDELLRWNRKVNLTAISDPDDILDRHFLDSMAVLADVTGGCELLDLGSGAGFPGLPMKLVRPAIQLTLVDSSEKKAAFLKHAVAVLGLNHGVKVICARARGEPDREGIHRASVVVSRAVARLDKWVDLGRPYLRPGGKLLAMLSEGTSEDEIEETARSNQMSVATRTYRLPISGALRRISTFQ